MFHNNLFFINLRWADQCTPGHDKNPRTEKHGSVGQNYAMTGSTRKGASTNWGKFVQMWYDEVTQSVHNIAYVILDISLIGDI